MDWQRSLPPIAFALTLFACDLPPGFNQVDPGEGGERTADTADVSPAPSGGAWETAFVGWQYGGDLNCQGVPGVGTPGGGVGGVGGIVVGGGGGGGTGGIGPGTGTESFPMAVEIWDGVEDPCGENPEHGDRRVRISLSASQAGTYQVAQQCVGPRTASVIFGEFRGGQLLNRIAVEGSVTVLGIEGLLTPDPDDDIVEGAFTVRFAPGGGFTSGSFRARSLCF
jgi:hypothetical protein